MCGCDHVIGSVTEPLHNSIGPDRRASVNWKEVHQPRIDHRFACNRVGDEDRYGGRLRLDVNKGQSLMQRGQNLEVGNAAQDRGYLIGIGNPCATFLQAGFVYLALHLQPERTVSNEQQVNRDISSCKLSSNLNRELVILLRLETPDLQYDKTIRWNPETRTQAWIGRLKAGLHVDANDQRDGRRSLTPVPAKHPFCRLTAAGDACISQLSNQFQTCARVEAIEHTGTGELGPQVIMAMHDAHWNAAQLRVEEGLSGKQAESVCM